MGDTTFRSKTFLFSSASDILKCLCDESKVELLHDAEWKEFPKVAEAYLKAGGEQVSLCIARCKGKRSWAVGAAGKWKARENAAKLALAVSLAVIEAKDS